MSQRVKFLKYMDSYRLIYRFEWDIVAVVAVSGIVYFAAATILQAPLWASPFFALIGAIKTLNLYKSLIKEAAPGYLYHFFYSIGVFNPTIIEKKNGKSIRKNPDNLPFGFENDFRD
jgi:hypothetical protein